MKELSRERERGGREKGEGGEREGGGRRGGREATLRP